MPLVAKNGVTPAVRIKDSRVYVGIVTNPSAPMNVKIDLSADAVKGANSLAIADIPTAEIPAHNFLFFKDPTTDLVYYPVEVRIAYAGGVALLVQPIKEAIPATAEAYFLSELCYRTEQNNQGQRNSQTYETICHTVAEQIAGSPTFSGNFPGGFSYFDAGIQILEYAALNGLQVVIEKRYPKPQPAGWTQGKIERGYGIPAFSGGNQNGAEASNFTINYTSYEVIQPVAA